MQVWMRSPSRCSVPDLKSRTWPASSGRTQVWQIPIRQPNGIWMPNFSPASRSDVAPSISMVFFGYREGDRPTFAAFVRSGDREAFHVQLVGEIRFFPMLLSVIQQSGGTTDPGRALLPIGGDFGEAAEVQVTLRFGEPQMKSVTGQRLFEFAQLVVEDHVRFAGRGVDVDDIGLLPARPEGSQHGHHWRDSAAGGDEEDFLRRRVGQCEIPLGRSQSHDCARFDALDEVRGQEPFRSGLDGDGDVLVVTTRHRGQRVRTPVPAPVDSQADADILTGLVVTGEAPPWLDRHGGRVFSFRLYTDNQATQLPRRPERVQKFQVVIGQQGRGRPGCEPARHIRPWCRGCLHAFCWRLAPSQDTAKCRTHSSSPVVSEVSVRQLKHGTYATSRSGLSINTCSLK